jgi:hypothetical protein
MSTRKRVMERCLAIVGGAALSLAVAGAGTGLFCAALSGLDGSMDHLFDDSEVC